MKIEIQCKFFSKQMLRTFLFVFLFALVQIGFAQSIGTSETVDYINQLLSDNPIYKKGYQSIVDQIYIENKMLCVIRTNSFITSDGVRFRLIDKYSLPVKNINCVHTESETYNFASGGTSNYLYDEQIYYSSISIGCDSCPDPNAYGKTTCVKKEHYTLGSFGFKEGDQLIDKDFHYYKSYGVTRKLYFGYYKDHHYPWEFTYLVAGFDKDCNSQANILNAFNHLIYLLKQDISNDPFEKPIVHNSTGNKEVSSPIIASNSSNIIPMKKKNGIYEVPVIVNGSLKLNFILDSGATDISLPPDVALTLLRTGTITKDDFIGSNTYIFADGTTAKSDVIMLREIKIGNRIITNVTASISNSIDAPLLLGQSLLNRLGTVTLDYTNGNMIIQK